MSSNSSGLTFSNFLPLDLSFSLILMAFSVICSCVSLAPPTRAKLSPVVTRLWPSESNLTPTMTALRLAFGIGSIVRDAVGYGERLAIIARADFQDVGHGGFGPLIGHGIGGGRAA